MTNQCTLGRGGGWRILESMLAPTASCAGVGGNPRPSMPNHELLVQSAIDFASSRFPVGELVAASARTKSGRILTGVWCDARVDSAALCAETGPICQAHAFHDPVTASICIARDSTEGGYRVLPACGVCQERLAFWGLDVLIAIPGNKYGGICDFLPLRELRPYYWGEL